MNVNVSHVNVVKTVNVNVRNVSVALVNVRRNKYVWSIRTKKPRKNDAISNLVNTGFYILEPEIINSIPKGFCMIEDLFPKFAKKGEVAGFLHDGLVLDIGTQEGSKKAEIEWTDVK